MLAGYSIYAHWDGGICWGPRYVVPVLPLLLLPAGELLMSGGPAAALVLILGAAGAFVRDRGRIVGDKYRFYVVPPIGHGGGKSNHAPVVTEVLAPNGPPASSIFTTTTSRPPVVPSPARRRIGLSPSTAIASLLRLEDLLRVTHHDPRPLLVGLDLARDADPLARDPDIGR
jgi:hypothetical protein